MTQLDDGSRAASGAEPASPVDLEAGWRLVGTNGRQEPLRLLIGQSRLSQSYLGLTIGRHPLLSELVVDDPTVSRRHARIGRNSEGLFVEDVNSLNGTFLDGRPLQPFKPVPLREGQSLVLGESVLVLEQLGAEPSRDDGGPTD